jgi:hypothetical protein
MHGYLTMQKIDHDLAMSFNAPSSTIFRRQLGKRHTAAA